MDNRRVVVTGMGVIANCGLSQDEFWEALCHSAPDSPDRQIRNFDPEPFFDTPKEARRQDRFAQFALATVTQALDQAGESFLKSNPARIGVHVGTGVGGLESIEIQAEVFREKGPRRVSPFLIPMMMPNAAAAAISIRYGFQGPCETTTTACTTGTQSIGNAYLAILGGRADAMVAGSAEASNTSLGIQAFINMTATSREGISRPFDKRRDGFLQSEGCGILILEELSHAEARGAKILGEIHGYGTNADAHHITAPSPQGVGAAACMELALESANMKPDEIKHINAHGTSTPLNDACEAEAIAKVFGQDNPPATSIKGITGHALGASGSLEAVASILSIQNKQLPPTFGFEERDPDLPEINIVQKEPQDWEPGPIISNSFGFGGHNASVIFGPA